MRAFGAMVGREVRSQLVSPVAWTVAAGFLLLSGYVFVDLVLRFAELVDQYAVYAEAVRHPALLARLNLNEFVIAGLYGQVLVLLLFLVPALTMRAFAEERRQGTEELLLTAPVSAGSVVAAKFAGIGGMVAAMILAVGAYVLGLGAMGDPEPGPAWTGLIGLVLAGLALTAVGIAVSSTTDSQVVSAIGSFVVGLLFFVVDWPARSVGEGTGRLLTALSIPAHFDRLVGGLVTVEDVVFFFSIMAGGLFAARLVLATRRWR